MDARTALVIAICFFGVSIHGWVGYWVAAIIADNRPRLRNGVVYALLRTASIYAARIDYPVIHRGGSIVGAMIVAMAASAVVFRRRGLAWAALSIRLVAAYMICEVFACPILLGLMALGIPNEAVVLGPTLDTFRNIGTVYGSVAITTVAQLEIAAGVLIWRGVIRKRWAARTPKSGQAMQYALIYTRFGLFIVVTGMIYANWINSVYVPETESWVISMEYMRVAPLFFVLAAVVISYFTQDLKYLSQLRRNDTLERQKAVSDALLSNLRSFRHNMVNMLYGFEGAILSEDHDRLIQYYQEMTQRCALVNNENIAALERVANPTVNAVLLRALDRAREGQFPLNLYVQKDIRFQCRMPDSDLCEALGVLLDNAIEAAMRAPVRFVSIEMRNADNSLEIIVKNTYAGKVTEADLRGGGSTKEGHMGHGLKSCHDVLARQRAAFLNFRITEQYVQAQLLIQMR